MTWAPRALDADAVSGVRDRPAPGENPLAGSIALVTGASRGLGAAVAIELAGLARTW